LPLHPTKGLCPLETQSGALPPTPPQGALPLDLSAGLCPAPQQGRCPCTPQGPLALDPSPGNPEGFPGCSFLEESYIFGLSLLGQPGGFPIAPWTPSESPPLLLVLTINKEESYIQIIPQALGLRVMGQGPNKTTCIRRFPKGDRKALWSPARAKPHLANNGLL